MRLPIFSTKNRSSAVTGILFPVEIWVEILTEALTPALILDTSCSSSNMEYFYCAIADEAGGGYVYRKVAAAKAARKCLKLVNKQFRSIVNSIHRKPRGVWVKEDDNEPRTYRAPVPIYQGGHPFGVEYDRFDLKMDYEETRRVVVTDGRPVSTFRLFLYRQNVGRETLAFIRSASEILYEPEALRVLHLFLDFCAIQSPRDFVDTLATKTSLLTTLSLIFSAAHSTIGIIYEPLPLPHLRTLFLKFHAYGASDDALESWEFPSLHILSVDLRIRRHGIDAVKSVPPFITKFIIRHGRKLDGLRLLPGPWSAPLEAEDVQSMTTAEHEELWSALPLLVALSCDFSNFPTYDNSLAVQQMLNRIVYLGQVKNGRPSSFATGLCNVIRACGALGRVLLRRNSIELLIDDDIWQYDDRSVFSILTELCQERNVTLSNVLSF